MDFFQKDSIRTGNSDGANFVFTEYRVHSWLISFSKDSIRMAKQCVESCCLLHEPYSAVPRVKNSPGSVYCVITATGESVRFHDFL
jgi:hypothetical protein